MEKHRCSFLVILVAVAAPNIFRERLQGGPDGMGISWPNHLLEISCWTGWKSAEMLSKFGPKEKVKTYPIKSNISVLSQSYFR